MDYMSGNRLVEESRYKSPENTAFRMNGSPDFAGFSSPQRRTIGFRGSRNKRYFNSKPDFNNSGHFNSPFNKQRRFGNGRWGGGRGGKSSDLPISAYVDSSMTEDPWREFQQRPDLSQSDQSQPDSSESPLPDLVTPV